MLVEAALLVAGAADLSATVVLVALYATVVLVALSATEVLVALSATEVLVELAILAAALSGIAVVLDGVLQNGLGMARWARTLAVLVELDLPALATKPALGLLAVALAAAAAAVSAGVLLVDLGRAVAVGRSFQAACLMAAGTAVCLLASGLGMAPFPLAQPAAAVEPGQGETKTIQYMTCL